jgi:stage II sporulation protein D
MADPRRLVALAVAVGAALVGGLVPAGPAHAQDEPAEEPTEPVDLGAYGQPLRFVATSEDTTFTLGDGSRYGGTLEARLSPSGTMLVVSDVTMQTYVEGLGEVPFSWPMAALKAQVVAARTYAWHSIQLATFVERGLGYDICDTVACQVYRGRDWVLGPGGDRWRQAVAETQGEVLTYEGEPILARYFSTSGGHTATTRRCSRPRGRGRTSRGSRTPTTPCPRCTGGR